MIAGATAALAAIPLAAAPAAPPAPQQVARAAATPAPQQVAPGVEWTRLTTTAPAGGPLRLNILRIDRAALTGRISLALAHDRVPGFERTSAMARRRGAVAAVNGSVWTVAPAAPGDPIGSLVADGRLVSEPLEGRSALLVPTAADQPATVRTLRFAGSVTAAGKTRLLDGVDRLRGVIPGCGGRGGDHPTEKPNATLVCRDPSELIAYSRAFGTRTRAQRDGVEVVVRASGAGAAASQAGTPAALAGTAAAPHRGGGTPIPADGLVLSGSGDAATLLAALHAGDPVTVDRGLLADGRPVAAADYAAVLGGGPRLLADGKPSITAAAEGYRPPNDPAWAQAIAARNPRTLAGVTTDGKLLLVTADGRRAGSVGLSYREAAQLLRSLGARDGINLDGGGSATMVVRGKVVNMPSDMAGERPVPSSVQVLP